LLQVRNQELTLQEHALSELFDRYVEEVKKLGEAVDQLPL
jgi:vacuolar-type H+-ATPase subunit E/Vma4